jgi:hypothetical protein
MLTDAVVTHEALRVTNECVNFFRGGEMLEMPIKLPRVVTDCVGTIEMGGAGEELLVYEALSY